MEALKPLLSSKIQPESYPYKSFYKSKWPKNVGVAAGACTSVNNVPKYEARTGRVGLGILNPDSKALLGKLLKHGLLLGGHT